MDKEDESNTFIALAKTLSGAGWRIVEFKDHGGGVTVTIVPEKRYVGNDDPDF
ncbi:MAG: hypothetical protein LBH43_18435 [Treponema sp.]|jgi:hypothetical protein|nr:hypothetical protein [Treponema sp.]